MIKLVFFVFLLLPILSKAGIHLTPGNPKEVHTAINSRYSPEAFGKYELAFYKRCKLGSKCEQKYGPWDISKKVTKKMICDQVKWFGNHIDCLQKYMNSLTGDLNILRSLLDERGKQLNEHCDMTVEGTTAKEIEDANEYYQRLARSVVRLKKIPAGTLDSRLGSPKKGKKCRQAVVHTLSFARMLDSAIEERAKISQHQKRIIGKHIPKVKTPEGLTFDGDYGFARFDGRVNEFSARPDRDGVNQCSDGRCLPSTKKRGSLVCPIAKKYQGCRPSNSSIKVYRNSGDLLYQNEQRCTEMLLKRVGGGYAREAYQSKDWNNYNKNLQAFMVKYPKNRKIYKGLIRSGLVQKRHLGGGRAISNKEAYACRELLDNPTMAAELKVSREFFHSLQILLAKEEEKLNQDSLFDLFHGVGEVVEDDMTRRMGEYSLQRRAFALLSLAAAINPEKFDVKSHAKELTSRAHSCDQSIKESKGFYNSLVKWGNKIKEELKDPSKLQAVKDSISIFNPLISGNLRDIDGEIAKRVKDGQDATPSLKKLASEVLEKGMNDLGKRCGNLELEAQEAILDDQVRGAYLNCQNETMACYGGFQLNWALCPLYTRAYNDERNSRPTREEDESDKIFGLVQLFGVGVLNGPLSKTHLTAEGLGLNRYFGTEKEMEGKIAIRFVQEADLSVRVSAVLERAIIIDIPDKDARLTIPENAKVNLGISGDSLWFDVRPKMQITWNGIHDTLPVTISLDSVQYNIRTQKFFIDRMTKVSPDVGGIVAGQVIDYAEEELAKLILPHLPENMREKGFTLNKDPRPELTMKSLQLSLSSLLAPHMKKESSKNMRRDPPLRDAKIAFSFEVPKTFNFPLKEKSLRMEAVAKRGIKVNGEIKTYGDIEDKKFEYLELSFKPEFEIATTEEGYKKSLQNIKIRKIKIKPNGEFEIDYKISIERSFDIAKYLGRLKVAEILGDSCTLEERRADTCKHRGTDSKEDVEYIRKYATMKLETGFRDAVADLLLRYDGNIPQFDLAKFLDFPLPEQTASNP